MRGCLTEFLRERKRRADEEHAKVDWDDRRRRWLDSLGSLYKTIEGWLGELKQQGTVSVSYEARTLVEEDMGSYEADAMVIEVGPERILLEPVGTQVVGARGRVDVKSSSSIEHATVVETEWDAWQIAVRTPRVTYYPLTEEAFTDVLREVMAE
jgi:hypothetical protein